MAQSIKFYFPLPDDQSVSETIDAILKNNGVNETSQEHLKKFLNSQDTVFDIAYGATLVLAEKKVPEQKMVDLLAEHLNTSKQSAQNIIKQLKEKLLPFATTQAPKRPEQVSQEQYSKENFQEELLNKIRTSRTIETELEPEQIPTPGLKEVPILDVEKNAQDMKLKGQNKITQERDVFVEKPKAQTPIPPPPAPSDKYKEPVE